ncbi:hypothetical protein AXG93_3656s1020 [Marchantia polymorpha subsp. ruderalis]|uniref:Uncharacterized protein n=1 Tax=Marchantia polymorpha subsp. ruderalis TaxID=1480154 RepID=A0A176WRM5_MARPO|nr:hypothetical protein AXG93_3656s1020 [Marchantia polymorpha subsp. ruderalis]
MMQEWQNGRALEAKGLCGIRSIGLLRNGQRSWNRVQEKMEIAAQCTSSVSGHRRLANKLDAFFTSSRVAVLYLELELAAVLQSEQVISLLRYIYCSHMDGKMAKYAEPAIRKSYVKLVRSKTKAKVAASAEVAERVASLTSKCATVKATLQEWEKQLQQSELECAKLRASLVAE